jgi:hypothetical protein
MFQKHDTFVKVVILPRKNPEILSWYRDYAAGWTTEKSDSNGAHPMSDPTGTGIIPLGVKLTIHLRLVQKLKMHGAVPPFPNPSSRNVV